MTTPWPESESIMSTPALIIRTVVRGIFWTIYCLLAAYFLVLAWQQDIVGLICVFALLCAPAVPAKIIEYQDRQKARVAASGRHVRPRVAVAVSGARSGYHRPLPRQYGVTRTPAAG